MLVPCPQSTVWRSGLVVVAMVASACNVPLGEESLSIVATDSAGITVVAHSGEESGHRWSASAEPFLRIGAVGGDSPYQFSRLVGASRLSDGTIVIANGNPSELRFYDQAGAHLRTVGRAGSGPGEFRSIRGIITAGDSIIAYDGTLRRISTFDQDGHFGELVDLVAPDGGDENLSSYGIAGLTGEEYFLLVPVGFSPRRDGTGISWVSAGPGLLYDRLGTLVDSVGESLRADSFSTAEFATTPPFGRFGRAVYRDGRLYATDGGRFEVRVYHHARTPSTIIRWNRPERPVTDALVEQWREQRLAGAEGEVRTGALETLRRIQHPETLPWIMDLVIDTQGFLWVREYSLPFDPQAAWYVFDSTGRMAGSVRLPTQLKVHEVGLDYILGSWTDDMDVEYVHMYELRRSE